MLAPLLFIASDRREAVPWVGHWERVRPLNLPVHWARTGKWRGRDVIAIANGVGAHRASGAVEAARTIAASFSGICSIGTAGGLDPSLAIADLVVATAVTDGQTTWIAVDPKGPPVRSGLVRTSQHIARTSVEKKNLRNSGAIIVDMESAAVARAALQLDVPFQCVRAVSDLANETFIIDFEQFLMPSGGFNVPRLIMYAVLHPVNGLGELLRLQRRTSLAARQLAAYLAECDF